MPLVAREVLKIFDNDIFLPLSLGAGSSSVALHFAAAWVFCLSSQRNYQLFYFPDTTCGRGARSYIFCFGFIFRPCGRAYCTTQTYFLWIQSCAFCCVRSDIWRGHLVSHWWFLGDSYEWNSWLALSWGQLPKHWWLIWNPFSARPKVQWICSLCTGLRGKTYSEMYWMWQGPWSIHFSVISHLREIIWRKSWRAHQK